jgi:hypothetical protein
MWFGMRYLGGWSSYCMPQNLFTLFGWSSYCMPQNLFTLFDWLCGEAKNKKARK